MTIRSNLFKKLIGIPLAVAMTLQGGWFIPAAVAQTPPAVPTLSPGINDNPFMAVGGASPNVLMVMDVSNSMDMDPRGNSSWTSDPNSKAHIARAAAKDIISQYGSKMNLGLMAYQQQKAELTRLHTMYLNISFSSAAYDNGTTTGNPRITQTNRRLQPMANNGTYFYYNDTTDANGNYNWLTSAYISGFNDNQSYYFWSPNGSNLYWTITANQPNTPNSSTIAAFPRMGAPGYADRPTNSTACGAGTAPAGATGVCTVWVGSDGGVGGLSFPWMATIPYGWAWRSDITGKRNVDKDVGAGFLHVPIAPAPDGSTQSAKLNLKLNDPVYPAAPVSGVTSNDWNSTAVPLQNGGATPIEGTLQTANTYFNSGLTSANSTAYPGHSDKPAASTCTRNFVVFLTDGLPSVRPDGSSEYTGVTTAQFNAGVETEAGNLKNSTAKVNSYWIGFGNDFAGGSSALNGYAAAGGTGTAYSAFDSASLNTAFSAIFAGIVAESSSYAAIAANSSQLTTDSAAYQARLKAADWSGDLVAWKLDPHTGAKITPQQWSAADQMPAGQRSHIYTYNPVTKNGIPFAWASLDAAQQAQLAATPAGVANLGGEEMLKYIAGNTSREGAGSGNYRARSSKLGDIVNGAPVYVGKPQMGYPDTIQGGHPYSTWAASQSSRSPRIYVGANDGMLHGLDAATGEEKFAYIPSAVYKNLPYLAAQTYAQNHKFFVDGQPSIGDAYIGSGWRTILVGGLNAGGQGIYALDVTNPSALGASSVLWEFTDKDDADLGYTFSVPAIAKTRNDKWVAIFGNGYNNTVADGAASASGNAVLYVVDLETGALIKKLDTGRGYSAVTPQQPNGLSTPAAADVDGDGRVEFVYAGDLQGNLWKFDLSDSSAASWTVANSGQPLFSAKDSTGKAQPITTRPEVSYHPKGGYLVYFGTGRAFQFDDINLTAPTNTFYGIWDKGSAVPSGGKSVVLQEQKITNELTSNGALWRLVTSNTVDWASKYGWYIDLVYPSASATGERVIGNPVFDGGRIVFVSVIPSTGADGCSAGGVSWLMDLDAYTGGRLSTSPFDVNRDGYFDGGDKLTGTGGPQPPAGMQQTGLVSSPNIQRTDKPGKNVKLMNSSSGDVVPVAESAAQGNRRQSWRDISAQ